MLAPLRRGALAGLAFGVAMFLRLPASQSASYVAVPGLLVTTAGGVADQLPAMTTTAYFPNPQPVVQAVGATYQRFDDPATDRYAYLLHATELPPRVPGVQVMSPGLRRNYGTYELVELIQQVGARFDARYPGATIRVGDLSRRRGGTIRNSHGRRVHSSHRNGLDADIMYLRTDCDASGRFDNPACPVGVTENLELMHMFINGGPSDETLMDVIFVGQGFRSRACKALYREPDLADQFRQVVQKAQVMTGHGAHFHIRLQCPERSRRCPAPRTGRPQLCPNLEAYLLRSLPMSG